MTPRGIRNNNPGNLERNHIQWQGMAADQSNDERFIVFQNPSWGVRAIAKVLMTYQDKRTGKDGSPIDTVQEIVERWAPPVENDTDAYARAVRRAIGVEPGANVNVRNWDTMMALVQAIIEHENGQQPYEYETLATGLTLAGLKRPTKPRPDDAMEAASIQADVMFADERKTGDPEARRFPYPPKPETKPVSQVEPISDDRLMEDDQYDIESLDEPASKFFAKSKTLWGALIAALASAAPVMSAFGIELPVSVEALGAQGDTLLTAAAGLAGTILVVWGRLTAKVDLSVKKD